MQTLVQEFLVWFSENFAPEVILAFRPSGGKAPPVEEFFPKARLKAFPLEGGALSLPLEDSSVDLVLILEGLTRLLDPWGLVRESKRVLRPKGFLLLVVDFSSPSPDDLWHFTPRLLEKFGDYIGRKLVLYQGQVDAPERIFLLASPEGDLPQGLPLYLGVRPLFPYKEEAFWAAQAFASPYHPRRAPLKYNLDPASVWGMVLELVPSGARVLDVGCGPGFVGAALAKLKGCRVSGIELNPLAAELARNAYEKVLEADLEKAPLKEEFPPESFDVVLFLDILEHLRQPAQTLKRFQVLLKPEGVAIVSVPNVAYASVVADLIRGRWQYHPWGILDETHFRFFTREGLFRLAEEAGFRVESLRRVVLDPEILEYNLGATSWVDLPAPVREFVRRENPEYRTYQFVALMRPGLAEKNSKTEDKFRRFLKQAQFGQIKAEG